METSENTSDDRRSERKLNAYLKNDLKQALLVLEGEETKEDDFQTFMLQANEIQGLLQMSVKYIDQKSLYRYDISGKMSLQTKYEKRKMSNEDIERLIQALLDLLQELPKFMLEPYGILLSPEYIFCDEEKYFFCYYPLCDLELTEEFHKLTEFLVREVDYRDKEGIHLAYTLHKSSMEDNYSIEKIMDEVVCEKEIPIARYDERISERVDEETEIAEKREFWRPVRKLFEKHRKEKDEWDEICPDDSDL